MKRNSFIVLCFSLILLLTMLGCPNAAVQAPKFDAVESYSTCPENFTVSNGLKGVINFSWNAFRGAKKYYIYSSSDQFGNYTKCYETSNTSFSFTDMPAGIDKYYYVVAVKRNGSLSNPSLTRRGTTLAAPVLNYIGAGDDEVNQAVVSWYMNNVDAYAENVEYTVYCYDSEVGGNLKGTKTSTGANTTVTFDGLGSYALNYYYVVAHNKNEAEDAIETSGARVDYRTAAETNPQPVTIKSFTQGNNGRYISINFELPEKVRVPQEQNALYPIKFKISRQIDGEDAWYEVDEFCGETNETTGKLGFYEQVEAEGDDKYVQGALITWTDKYADSLGRRVETGKKYNYAIKSFADYKTTITSGQSSAFTKETKDDEGNLLGNAYLFVSPKVEIASHTATDSANAGTYAKYTTTFNFENNSNGAINLSEGYDIYIGAQCTSFTDAVTTVYTKITEPEDDAWGINATWSYPLELNLEGDNAVTEGSYKYQAFVVTDGFVPSNGTSFADLESNESTLGAVYLPGAYLVCKDKAQPSVPNFSVVSGMTSKIQIKFDAKANMVYKLTYVQDGVEKEYDINKRIVNTVTDQDGHEAQETTYSTTSGFTCNKGEGEEGLFWTGSKLTSDVSGVVI
nr:hypothetical protein [Treponemataceae bacterium]